MLGVQEATRIDAVAWPYASILTARSVPLRVADTCVV